MYNYSVPVYKTITLSPAHTTHTVTDVERDSEDCDNIAVDIPVAMDTAAEPCCPFTRQLPRCVCVCVWGVCVCEGVGWVMYQRLS